MLMKNNPHSVAVQKALARLGRDINIARRKRRMSIADFASRMRMSQGTVIRLEKGEPGVSIQALAMALLALGEIQRLHNLLDIASDNTGLLFDMNALPQRIRRPGKRDRTTASTEEKFS